MTLPWTIDKHALALISIAGSSLDVLGALYLAYDLLGGEHGPLRTLTRAVTYGALFGIAYGIVLGPAFGLASGVANGVTLAWEFSRAARHEPTQGFRVDAAMSAIRGCGFGVGLAWLFGPVFGTAFGVLSAVGQVIAYQFGIRPTMEYQPAMRPRFTRAQLFAAANRTFGYAVAGYICSLIARRGENAIAIGLKTGLGIGMVTALIVSLTPFVEWTADRLPERRMGVLGVGLILAGFTLQSVQYWVALLDVSVR